MSKKNRLILKSLRGNWAVFAVTSCPLLQPSQGKLWQLTQCTHCFGSKGEKNGTHAAHRCVLRSIFDSQLNSCLQTRNHRRRSISSFQSVSCFQFLMNMASSLLSHSPGSDVRIQLLNFLHLPLSHFQTSSPVVYSREALHISVQCHLYIE